MTLLIKEGADVKFVKTHDSTSENSPLSAAVSSMHESAVEYLLARGADVHH